MFRDILKANWQVFLAACVLCAGFSAAFLLKGEDLTYYGFASETSFGTRGVSAYTYYFVWPESQRETVAQNEEVVAVLQSMAGGQQASDMTGRMRRNIILAIVFGLVSAALALAICVAGFSTGDRR